MSNVVFEFGSGNVFLTPVNFPGSIFTTNNPSPIELGTLQDVSIEMSQSTKDLYGKLRSPVAIATTEMKTTATAKSARFSALAMNYFWGSTITAGNQQTMAINSATGLPGEPQTPSSGTITVANPPILSILGVYDTVTGLYMTEVTSGSPTTGQFKVTSLSSGTIAVPSGDTNPKLIFYVYALSSSTGFITQIANLAMGTNPLFSIYLFNNQWQGAPVLLEIFQATSTKLNFGWKNTDWMIPDWGFTFMDPGTGILAQLSTPSVG
jgi:hypothetical protein